MSECEQRRAQLVDNSRNKSRTQRSQSPFNSRVISKSKNTSKPENSHNNQKKLHISDIYEDQKIHLGYEKNFAEDYKKENRRLGNKRIFGNRSDNKEIKPLPIKQNNRCLNCFGCSKVTSEYLYIPNCKLHQYCNTCFENQKKIEKSNCKNCSIFFSIKIASSIVGKCTFCNSEIENKTCKDHSYCKECLEFLLKNNYDHLVPTSDCNVCIYSIKQLKNKNIELEEAIKLMNDTLEQPKIIISLTNKIPKLTNHNQASYSKDEDYFKNTNLKNEGTSKNLIKSIESRRSKSSREKTKETIIKRSSSVKNDLRYSYNSISDFVYCSMCSKTNENYGFLCNHNICSICLTYYCCLQIYYFFMQYQGNKDLKDNIFSYKCPVQGCNQSISVPSTMIYSLLCKYAYDSNLQSSFQYFTFMINDNFLNWVPYFDGLMQVS